MMLRLVKEDWTETLRARLRSEAAKAPETPGVEVGTITPEPSPPDLFFGPYGSSPISGLHFDAADDTAAS